METTLCIEAGSSAWPSELDDIEKSPERLWARGRADLLDRNPRVAIVGTRAPTPYGAAQAERFARAIAREGVCVVSGLARGVDQIAHRATLDEDGATIAVLGNGVDRPWPDEPITHDVARRGLLLSELQPGTPPRPHHFPLRNRLIAGLSSGVLVVEAAHASGSLITARWAADQGKTVWAIPGRIDHPMARGTHRLIREGALLVESPDEILDDVLQRQRPDRDDAEPGHGSLLAGLVPGSPARRIVEVLRGETLVCDEIAERVGAPPSRVLADLTMLELAGRVVRAPGALWRLAAV